MGRSIRKSSTWEKWIEQSADPLRAAQFSAQLAAADASKTKRLPEEQVRILCSIFGASQVLSEWIVSNPQWLDQLLLPETLQNPRQVQGMRREVDGLLREKLAQKDYANAF